MELITPGEQHFYMKAVNAAERQRWLVALGSSKACLTDTRTKKEKEISETSESLKTKMSELRLYCDLLMQQVLYDSRILFLPLYENSFISQHREHE
uniref:Putative pleckstrin logy domain-containing family a member 8 n=1 Tax=Ixodes ricinus TaxID=34613 RepID=A0A0K8RJH3_IXORI